MTETDRTDFTGFCVPATELNTLCGCVVCSSLVFSSLGFHGPPGSSVYEIFLTRILEWVAMFSSRGSSWPKDWTHTYWIYCIAGGFFTTEPSGKPHSLWVVKIIELCWFFFFFFQQRNDLVRIEFWINCWWYFAKSGLRTQYSNTEDTILFGSRQRLMRRCCRSPVKGQCCPDYGIGSCKGGNKSRDTEDLESEGCVDLPY